MKSWSPLAGLSALVVIVVAVGATVAWLLLAGSVPGSSSTAPIPWSLQTVSADGRTLEIVHEVPHCQTKPGRRVVRESADRVEITVPQVRTGGGIGTVCTLDQRFGVEHVRLAAPLGGRTLIDAGRRTGTGGPLSPEDPEPQACTQLEALPRGAPAFDVPWVAKRLQFCTAPVPPVTLRLPIMQRRRTTTDRLPRAFAVQLAQPSVVLRPALTRRLVPSERVWLVPGPDSSCVARFVRGQALIGHCRPTGSEVGTDGLVVPTTCFNRTPKRVTLVGLVPAGVGSVRLTPRHGSARTVRVRGGTWRAQVSYPFQLTYGRVTVTSSYEFRSCWG